VTLTGLFPRFLPTFLAHASALSIVLVEEIFLFSVQFELQVFFVRHGLRVRKVFVVLFKGPTAVETLKHQPYFAASRCSARRDAALPLMRANRM
jgi:hypothetical protein